MYAFDLLAAVALAAGGLLGARRGLWKMLAGGSAVMLGAGAAWATSEVLAAALRDWGAGPPGDVVLGFFLPFALVSVYARFIIGLWLSRRLEKRPEHNRFLGAAAGVTWMLFAVGLAARAGGLDQPPARPETCAARGRGWTETASGPLTRWLARYPGGVGARMYLRGLRGGEEDGTRLTGALKGVLDAERAQRRASRADEEAFESLREKRPVPLRVGTVPEER